MESPARKPRRLVAGLMSGTSADAIDCAICSITGSGPARDVETGEARTPAVVRLEAFRSQPMDSELRARILASGSCGVREIAELHGVLGDAFAQALLKTLVITGTPEEALDLAGSHGQTVFHHGGNGVRATLQIADGDRIAEQARVTVVSDFRARDIATGGEGAPLTPYADSILYPPHPSGAMRVILNLGGISNITILDPDPRRIIAFDCGPANAPLDRLARRMTGGEWSCDVDGAIASSGVVNESLLYQLLEHPFIKKAPPKSTGTEMFGDEFVEQCVAKHGATRDLMATLAVFVVKAVARAIATATAARGGEVRLREVVVAGGGGRNRFLFESLQREFAPAAVVHSDDLGVPSAAREAMAFAILANDALFGLPTNLPQVTGARAAVSLGKFSFAKGRRDYL